MRELNNGKEYTAEVLKWINNYREYWRRICTPNDDLMTEDIMKRLIKILWDQSLYDIILVMITVHRNTPFVSDLLIDMSNYMISTRWKNESEALLNRMINYL